MDITVLDIQILKALHREVKEVSLLIKEITAPYKALQQYRDDGLIPFIKLERKILFRESDIIKVLEDNYQR